MKKENMLPMQRWGGEMLALVVLVPLVIVIGAVLIRWPALSEQAVEMGSHVRDVLPMATGTEVSNEVKIVEVEVKEGANQLQAATLIITGAGENGQYQVPAAVGDTVTEIMEQAKADGLIGFEAINYGGSLGMFFEEINGVKNNQVKNNYWHLYLNGEKAQVGASAMRVEFGDVVEWKYEEQDEL